MDQNVCLNTGKKDQLYVCYCAQQERIGLEGFTQNGCHGKQPQSFEVVFYSIDASISCFFTKQDLTVK